MSGLAKYIANGTTLKKASGDIEYTSLSGKLVFFYFSASWCPPCRGFTPQLVEFYGKFHEKKNFEVIFVSWDEEEDDFDGYFGKMPWAALPFSDRAGMEALTKQFNVQSIPTLIGVDANTGNVVTTKARAELVKDTEGEHFPWSD